MNLIGLTGGIATGKSSVSKMIQAKGLPVIDADFLAREVVSPGSFGQKALVQVFGPGILSGEELNRKLLGQKLFADPVCRRVVENITHPLIQWRAKQEFAALEKAGHEIIFYDAALLFEKSLTKNFNLIVVVHAPEKIQIDRLIERDKISKTEAEQRVNTQMPMAKKIAEAHLLIDNGGTLKQTESQVEEILSKLLK